MFTRICRELEKHAKSLFAWRSPRNDAARSYRQIPFVVGILLQLLCIINMLHNIWECSECRRPMYCVTIHMALYTWAFSTKVRSAGLILGLRPANEWRRYKVTSSFIGWAQTLNQPWNVPDCCYMHPQSDVPHSTVPYNRDHLIDVD